MIFIDTDILLDVALKRVPFWLVTRNKDDFHTGKIPVYTAKEYLEMISKP